MQVAQLRLVPEFLALGFVLSKVISRVPRASSLSSLSSSVSFKLGIKVKSFLSATHTATLQNSVSEQRPCKQPGSTKAWEADPPGGGPAVELSLEPGV